MTDGAVRKLTGLEDLKRSLRDLVRCYCNAVEATVGLAESQLSMAIGIAEQLRESVVSEETLERARQLELPAKLRADGHRAVDLIVDLNAVALLTATDFVVGKR